MLKSLTKKKDSSAGTIKIIAFVLGLILVAYASIKWGFARRAVERDKADLKIRKAKLEDARVSAKSKEMSEVSRKVIDHVFERIEAENKRLATKIALGEEKLKRDKQNIEAAKSWDALEAS